MHLCVCINMQYRSRQRGPQDPGHQQPQRSTEPGKPTAGTTTHPPRRLQRKPPDRVPTSIGQRPPGNQGQRPTDPARPQSPRHGPRTGPGPQNRGSELQSVTKGTTYVAPSTTPHRTHPTCVSVCCVQEPEGRGLWGYRPGEGSQSLAAIGTPVSCDLARGRRA